MERIGMRTTRNNKGQMRVIETILASFIIVSALSFVNIFAITPTSQKYEVTDLEKMGYSLLHDLDQHGLLARFVYNGEWDNREWENLKAALRVSLPLDVYFNMTVYNLNYTKVTNATIFYGDPEIFATSKNVASVTYGLIGYPKRNQTTGNYQAIYDPRILILQLARG
jgi:hypothetical protein